MSNIGARHYREKPDPEVQKLPENPIHSEILRRAQIVEMTCLCGIKFKTTAGEKETGARYCPKCRKKKNCRDKLTIRQIHSGGVFDSEF